MAIALRSSAISAGLLRTLIESSVACAFFTTSAGCAAFSSCTYLRPRVNESEWMKIATRDVRQRVKRRSFRNQGVESWTQLVHGAQPDAERVHDFDRVW